MEDNTKTTNKALQYGAAGLLVGGGTMSLLNAIKDLRDLHAYRSSDRGSLNTILVREALADRLKVPTPPAVTTPEAQTEELEEEAVPTQDKTANTDTTVGGRLWEGLKDKSKDLGESISNLTSGTQDRFVDFNLRNAALLAGLLAGGYGVERLWNKSRLNDITRKADDVRNYYFSRLADIHNLAPGTVVTQRRVPLKRTPTVTSPKQKKPVEVESEEEGEVEKKANVGKDFLLWSLMAGVPLSTGYLVKRYLDETQPKLSRPNADESVDPRTQVRRLTHLREKEVPIEDISVEEIEDLLEGNYSDYLGALEKEAAVSPAQEEAFRTAHLVHVFLANEKKASHSILSDLVKVVENEGISGLTKVAKSKDMDAFINYIEKKAAQFVKTASSERSRYLAVELMAAEPFVRSMVHPIACAEYLEVYPTNVKLASDADEGTMEAVLHVAKLQTLAHESVLLGDVWESEHSKQASTDATGLESYVKHMDGILSGKAHPELRKLIFN